MAAVLLVAAGKLIQAVLEDVEGNPRFVPSPLAGKGDPLDHRTSGAHFELRMSTGRFEANDERIASVEEELESSKATGSPRFEELQEGGPNP